MNFEVQSTEFWDQKTTRKEILRVFDVCHGCRVCQTICPSFVNLFQSIDDKFGNVDALSNEEVNQVVNLCYQCKLCYPIRPYVPPHEWDIVFPRTMMRAKLVETRQRGIRLADRIMGDTDKVGTLASLAAPLVNWVNRNPVASWKSIWEFITIGCCPPSIPRLLRSGTESGHTPRRPEKHLMCREPHCFIPAPSITTNRRLEKPLSECLKKTPSITLSLRSSAVVFRFWMAEWWITPSAKLKRMWIL